MQTEFRVLTLHRPWPSAILYGSKRIENRSWKPWESVIGQYIAIHAGVKYDDEAANWMREEGLYDAPYSKSCPIGIVGLVRVTGFYDDTTVIPDDDPWWFGPVGWKLADPIAFDDPIPCRGTQGLWRVPEAINKTLAEAADAVTELFKERLDEK